MTDWQLHFLLGAIGALAPEVVRLRTVFINGGEYTWSRSLVIFSILYAAIAGLVAAILPSANPYAAFYSGISTDVLIGKAHAAAAGTRKRKKASQKKAADDTSPPPRLSPLDSFLDAL
jgi:hypothetical protein